MNGRLSKIRSGILARIKKLQFINEKIALYGSVKWWGLIKNCLYFMLEQLKIVLCLHYFCVVAFLFLLKISVGNQSFCWHCFVKNLSYLMLVLLNNYPKKELALLPGKVARHSKNSWKSQIHMGRCCIMEKTWNNRSVISSNRYMKIILKSHIQSIFVNLIFISCH